MKRADVHGVLIVDKPSGPTSHDIVRDARKLYGTREVGHAGTLDPLATGVLVVLLGEATKLSAYLTAAEKSYRAVVAFGRSTDTLDADGSVVEERALALGAITPEAIERALALERARTEQEPPLFSAISVGGERAHRIGRSGGSVELAKRAVSVATLELVASDAASATVELRVSKGYYVRSFARDLGAALGVPAHLASLRRLASGPITLAEAVSWPPPAPPALVPLERAARLALPWAELGADGVVRARQGKPLGSSDFTRAPPPGASPAAWFGPSGELVALGSEAEPGHYRVLRGFRDLSAP